jgi:two-component system OmpR family sensor kinase
MDHTMKSDARGWSLRMLLVLGAAAVALWVLLQAVLTPLERMATLADRIRAGERNLRMNEAHSGKGRDELSRLSAAFDRMLDAVTSSEEEMRRFLAEASHELRTPLTAVGGYVDVMRRGAVGSDADRRRIFQAIRDEIDRMARLVSELLTLARLQGSLEREELLRLDVPLSPLLENLLEGARLRSAGRALALQVAPDGPEDAVLQGDPDRLRQAFGNLIENALTHSRPGGGLEILLSTDAARNFAEVSFQDDGPVIPADRRSPIFQRFVKGPASPGSGLGLTIVQAILAAHGGSVRLETNERGNRFVVRLPLREGVSPPERLINGSARIQ